MYSAAQRAVLSSELSAGAADLVRIGGLAALEETGEAQACLKVLAREVQEVERALGRTKKLRSDSPRTSKSSIELHNSSR